jgi:hypothetical protein
VKADIARRERITRARVTQIMFLLKLPPEMKEKLLGGSDESVKGMTIRRAIEMVVGG